MAKDKDALASFFHSLPRPGDDQLAHFRRHLANLEVGDVPEGVKKEMEEYLRRCADHRERGLALRDYMRPHWMKKYHPGE